MKGSKREPGKAKNNIAAVVADDALSVASDHGKKKKKRLTKSAKAKTKAPKKNGTADIKKSAKTLKLLKKKAKKSTSQAIAAANNLLDRASPASAKIKPKAKAKTKSGVKRPAVKGLPPIDPKTGKIDRAALIEQYEPYVRSIAGKAKKGLSKEIEFTDLVSYGMVGLLEAAGRYDPKFGANFMTFSYYRIRGAIYDGLRNMGWVSRSEYAKHRFEARATAFLANVADRQNYGDEGKTTEDEVEELADTVSNLVTIFVTSLEGMEHVQFEDKDLTPIDMRVDDEKMKAHLHEALQRLPEQERNLIAMYYYKEMSLQQVGDQMGLSKSWTSRLHAKAIEKLSRILREILRQGGQR